MAVATYQEILDFWFSPEVVPVQFAEDPDLDDKIRERFLDTWYAAKDGLLSDWRVDIRGRVAEIIVLDQFSRNIWRNNRYSLSQDEKKFVLLPYMHSESLGIHEQAIPLYEDLGSPETLKFEKMHVDVLKEFGRYPYQNADLGRESTPAEIEFLNRTQGKAYGEGK